mmetsp:Transcript_65214/g.135044  ORF Transcript_65214/g.135044 Transcript_65214/m.135044 type:complete len:234 (+) Transcript_65214:92-793(+)
MVSSRHCVRFTRSLRLQTGHKLLDALTSFCKPFARLCKGYPDQAIATSPKEVSVEDCDTILLEQSVCKLRGAHSGSSNICKKIHGSRWTHSHGDARNLNKLLVNQITPGCILQAHRGHHFLRRGQRRFRTSSDEGGNTCPAIDCEVLGGLNQLCRKQSEAQAPASHGEGLAAAIQDHGAFQHVLAQGDAVRLTIENKPRVDLVAQYPAVASLCNLCCTVEVLSGEHPTRWIAR